MNLSIGLSLTRPSGPLGFNPASLFANGEEGAWYDPSDLSTLFQDTAGATPAGVGDPVGLILDKSKGRNYPAQFFPDIPIPLFSANTAIQAALIENALIANSGVYYVSPSTGSDSNAGTEAAPFQTVSKAIRTATGAASRVVMLEDAVIEPFDLRSIDASQTTQQFKWLDANGFDVTIRVAGPDLSSQTWTQDGTYTNCYTTVLSIGASAQVTRVLNQSLADDYGYDLPLREYSSEALLDAATDAGYYWDNSTKTLWMNIDGNVEAQKANYRALYLNSAGTSRIFISGASLGLSGVKLEGVQIFSLDAAGRRPEVWMHDVEQVYAYGKGGDVRGWYVATDCTVYGSGADGCNAFTAWAGGKSLIQDVRCRFIRSGDRRTFAVNGSNQGVSAHGGSYHIAHDCEYIENNGQGVADTCVNSSTDYSWLIDCRVVGGAPGVTADNFLFGSAATSAARIAFLDNCVSESSSSNDLSVQVNGTVQRLSSDFVAVSGASLPYGNHATQSTPTARPTLAVTGTTPETLGSEEVTNGTFDAGLTGWTSGAFDPATLDSGGAKIERNGVTNSALVQTSVFIVGKTYRISYDVLSGSGNTGASLLIAGQNADSVPGSYSFVYTATTTTFEARCYLNNYATVDNISVKEVLTWADAKYYLDFDGSDDWLRATFSANQAQPNTLAAAFKFNQGSRNEFVVDGVSTDRNAIYKTTTDLQLFAGSSITDSSAAGTTELVALGHLNTTSSELRVNGTQVATGDVGSSQWGGITLGADSSDALWLDGRIYGFVGVNRTLTAGEIDDVESYLATKSGVTL